MIYRFDGFEFDTELFEIRRGSSALNLTPRVFDLIGYLIENRERVVPKGELMDAIWQTETVSEESLTRAISSARSILELGRMRGDVIKTAPKRGYRFVASVEAGEGRSHDRDPKAEAEAGTPPRPGGEDSSRTRLPSVDTGMVGRDREFESVRDSIAASKTGIGTLLLAYGEPGIGKTRFADAAASNAQSAALSVFVSRCPEARGAPAFWPWTCLLEKILEKEGAIRFKRMLSDAGPAAARLISGLEIPYESVSPDPSGPEANRFELFASIRRLLKTMSSENPTMIIFEDLQRADPASLQLLQFVAEEIRGTSVVLLGTYRDTEVAESESAIGHLDRLRHVPGAIAIALDALSVEQVGDVAQGLGMVLDLGDARLLHQESGGNPFFVEQLVSLGGRNALASGKLSKSVAKRGRRGLISEHLKIFSESNIKLLCVAALLGREFAIELVCDVSGETQSNVFAAIDAAERARVIESVERKSGRFRFLHDLIRMTLYAETGLEQRSLLHAKIAEALVNRAPVEPGPHLAEIVHHAQEALPFGDPRRAVEYSAHAGAWAGGRLAFEEAAGHYDVALKAWDAYVGTQDEFRCDLLLALARERKRCGQRDDAKRVAREAADLARRLDSPDRLAQAVFALWPTVVSFDQYGSEGLMIQTLREALEKLDGTNPALEAKILSRIAMDYRFDEPFVERSQLAARAIEVAERSGDPGALAWALSTQLFFARRDLPLSDRIAVARRVVRAGEEAEGIVDSVTYRKFLFILLAEAGMRDQASQELAEIEAIAEESANAGLRNSAVWVRRKWRAVQGTLGSDWDDETTAGDTLVDIQKRIHWLFSACERGHWERARERVETDFMGHFGSAPGENLIRAWVLANQNDPADRAEACLLLESEVANESSIKPQDAVHRAWTLSLSGMICLEVQSRPHAKLLFDRLLPYRSQGIFIFGSAYYLGVSDSILGALAHLTGDAECAVEFLEAAIAHDEKFGAKPAVILHRKRLALVLRDRNVREDRRRATELEALAQHSATDLYGE